MTKRKVFSSLYKTFISLLLTVLVVFMGYLLYHKTINKVPCIFGYSALNVISGSMEDTIPQGSHILIKKVNQEELKVGDIISFYSKDPAIYGKANTHRIVEIIENGSNVYYVTKGDANVATDSYTVTYDDIIGRYEKTLNLLTKINWLFDNPVIYFLLIIIPAGLLFIIKVRNVVKKAKGIPKEEIEEKSTNENKS